MKAVLIWILILGIVPANACEQSLRITGPNRAAMLEGETYSLTWRAEGIESVSVVAHGARTQLGTTSRGEFVIALAEAVPAWEGEVRWTVPWLDSIRFFVKIKGYDASGAQVALDERGYGFRPAVMADRTADGIFLDLHERRNQRLYVQKDYRVTHAYVVTSSENYLWLPPGRHVGKPHDHAGVFAVLEKKRSHWSRLFRVTMPWAMRYHAGHFIHATSPNLYGSLGRPASHGCNRLTRHDARELYRTTPVGARVEVIGPED